MTLSDSPPGAHRRVYGTHAPPQWVSHVARITFPTCRAHYPGGPDGGFVDLLPHPYCLPRSRRVGIRNCTFEACSGFIRIRPIGSLDRPRRPLSRGFNTASYPATPLVSYQSYRLLSGWILPPLVIRAFVAHRDARGPEDHDKPGFILGGSVSSPVENWSGAPPALIRCHDQNRKYRCAIGSTVAGSQVSSSPSARTS